MREEQLHQSALLHQARAPGLLAALCLVPQEDREGASPAGMGSLPEEHAKIWMSYLKIYERLHSTL